jgi:hypothetical protein
VTGAVASIAFPVVLWLRLSDLVNVTEVKWLLGLLVLVTALSVSKSWRIVRNVLRSQGLLPVMRWRQVDGAWELRFANETHGWRTVAALMPGDTIELAQHGANTFWREIVFGRPKDEYRRCAIYVSGASPRSVAHVRLPLHRRYVQEVQEAMREDGLFVTFVFRSFIHPGSPYDEISTLELGR